MHLKYRNFLFFKKRILVSILILSSIAILIYLFLINTSAKMKNGVPAQHTSFSKGIITTDKSVNITKEKQSLNTGDTNINSNPVTIKGNITLSRATQLNGSLYVSLRTVIEGINKGSCLIDFSKKDQVNIQLKVDVVPNSNYYECSGVEVPVNIFPVGGDWNLSIHVVNSQSQTISNIATQNNIQITK